MSSMTAAEREIEIDMPAPAPIPATVGRYRIRGEIASGGMASVYLGVSEGESQPGALRAIKRVHPHLAQQREFVEMFVDEARIASRIRHPNVCSVLEWGESEGTFYLAMELLAGEPLNTLIRAVKKHPDVLADPRWARCAARIVADACAGLHAAHELEDDRGEPMHVVHRDVSPHNIFVTWDGVAKVVDFGVASAKHRLHQTTTGMVKGKFAYMPPEQLQGAKVDRRADVWSLGVVLWELLTGRPLFRRTIETETIFAVLNETIPSFASVCPSGPVALEAIARRALMGDVEKRTTSARAMQAELESWLAGEGGFEVRDVALLLAELFPGEREQHAARVERSLVGATTLTPRRDGEPTPPTGAPRSVVQRRDGRPARGWIGAMIVIAGIASIAGAAAAKLGTPWTVEPASAAIGASTSERDTASPPATSIALADAPASASPAAVAAAPLAIDAPAPVEAPAPSTAPARRDAPAQVEAPAVAMSGSPSVDGVSAAVRAGVRRASRELAASAGDDEDGDGPGELDIATPGGWAEVWMDGQRLGHTPGRFHLPAGRHTLILRAGEGGEEHRAAVRIVAGQLARLRVDLDR